MPLDFGEEGAPMKNVFPHSSEFEQGSGAIRKGMGTFVVALDGSGDFDDIQEAIDALPTEGGVVFIKEGTYEPKTDILITKSNTSLVGTGTGTIIKPGHIDDIAPTNEHGVIKIGNGIDQVESIRLENFKINGNYAVQTNAYTRNIYCQKMVRSFITNIISGYSIGAVAVEIKTSSIENRIANCDVSQITTISSNANIIEGNILGGISCGNAIKHIVISSNFFETEGIKLTSLDFSTITNNIITDADYGIDLTTSDNNVISGNVIEGNSGDGVELNTSDNNVISGNLLSGNSGYGIDIKDNTSDKNVLIGNHCLGNTAGAINDAGTNTHPNGASGTNNLALDDLNIIA